MELGPVISVLQMRKLSLRGPETDESSASHSPLHGSLDSEAPFRVCAWSQGRAPALSSRAPAVPVADRRPLRLGAPGAAGSGCVPRTAGRRALESRPPGGALTAQLVRSGHPAACRSSWAFSGGSDSPGAKAFRKRETHQECTLTVSNGNVK